MQKHLRCVTGVICMHEVIELYDMRVLDLRKFCLEMLFAAELLIQDGFGSYLNSLIRI